MRINSVVFSTMELVEKGFNIKKKIVHIYFSELYYTIFKKLTVVIEVQK